MKDKSKNSRLRCLLIVAGSTIVLNETLQNKFRRRVNIPKLTVVYMSFTQYSFSFIVSFKNVFRIFDRLWTPTTDTTSHSNFTHWISFISCHEMVRE